MGPDLLLHIPKTKPNHKYTYTHEGGGEAGRKGVRDRKGHGEKPSTLIQTQQPWTSSTLLGL